MLPEDPKFKGIYRIPSARLPGFDYGSTGLYFVTICTQDRKKYFGEVYEGQTILSPIGRIAQEELLKTSEVRPNVNIDTWVIMPNHTHFIVGIDNQKNETQYNGPLASKKNNIETPGVSVSGAPNFVGRDTLNVSLSRGVNKIQDVNNVRDAYNASLRPIVGPAYNTFGPQRQNLAAIIRGFKGAVTSRVQEQFGENYFSWQSRFHDHIIRDEQSLIKIRQYIVDNPVKWFEDEMFVE